MVVFGNHNGQNVVKGKWSALCVQRAEAKEGLLKAMDASIRLSLHRHKPDLIKTAECGLDLAELPSQRVTIRPAI